jgi:hypothetical protein
MEQNNTITATAETATQSGKKIIISAQLILQKTVSVDGDRATVPACEIQFDISCAGQSQGGWITKRTSAMANLPAVYTHIVGNLPLTTEQADLAASVQAEIEARPEWIAHQAFLARHTAEDAAYEANYNAIRKTMAE